jgi:hypothetical protein
MRSLCCLYVCVSVYPPYQLFNAWRNPCETWFVHHSTWAHLNYFLRKSLPSICVFVCVSVLSLLGNGSVKCIHPFGARQWLGKHFHTANEYTQQWKNYSMRHFLWGPCLIKGGYVGLSMYLLSLLNNNSVKTFPRQRRIVEDALVYEVVSYQRKVGD